MPKGNKKKQQSGFSGSAAFFNGFKFLRGSNYASVFIHTSISPSPLLFHRK